MQGYKIQSSETSTVCKSAQVSNIGPSWSSYLNVFSGLSNFTRFHMGPSVERVLPSCLNGSGALNKMASLSIYGKNLKNLLLQNQESFWAETWYIALLSQALPSFFKQ